MNTTKWRVLVYVNGKDILHISDEDYSGIPVFTEEQADAIREAGENLLAFIGEKKGERRESAAEKVHR